MAKDKVSITLDRDVLAAADADAKAAGLNRSELVEQALRHIRRQRRQHGHQPGQQQRQQRQAHQAHQTSGL